MLWWAPVAVGSAGFWSPVPMTYLMALLTDSISELGGAAAVDGRGSPVGFLGGKQRAMREYRPGNRCRLASALKGSRRPLSARHMTCNVIPAAAGLPRRDRFQA